MSEQLGMMTRRAFCAAGLAALGAAPPPWKGVVAPNPVKLGLVSSLFREVYSGAVLLAMHPFKTYLDAVMEVTSKLVASGDAFSLAKDLGNGTVHLGVFHGTEFAWAVARYPKLKPLFIAVNGEPRVTAHLIVKKSSPARDVTGVQDNTLAIPFRTREHCYLFLERRGVKPGIAPDRFYEVRDKIPTPEDALEMVADGQAGVALIDHADWAAYQAASPKVAAGLRTLISSEALPCGLVASWEGVLDGTLVKRFTEGMLSAHKTPKGRDLLKVMRITGFQRIPEDFDRQLSAAAKAYPPTK